MTDIVRWLLLLLLGSALAARVYQRFRARPRAFVRASLAAQGGQLVVEDHGDYRELLHIADERVGYTRVLLADPLRSGYAYTDAFHLCVALNITCRNVLCIGAGGGVTAQQFAAFYPQLEQLEVVEIDDTVLELAREFFGLSASSRLSIRHACGREFLAAHAKPFDIIILDAFTGRAIPDLLTEPHVLRLFRERLSAKGILCANVVGALAGALAEPVQALQTRVEKVFGPAQVVLIPIALPGEVALNAASSRNFVLFAARSALALAKPAPVWDARLTQIASAYAELERRLVHTENAMP